MKITSRLVAERVWIQGRSGASRPGVPRGPLRNAVEDGRVLVLQFLSDGKRIERTNAWQKAGELLATPVAGVLRRLTGSRHSLLLSVGGPSVKKRRLAARLVTLSSDEHVLLDYGFAERSGSFAFFEARGPDYRHSRLLVEPARRDVAAILRGSWGWQAVRAYVIPRSKVENAMKAWHRLGEDVRQREIKTLFRYATIVCEEWSDGGALRFWSMEMTHAELAKKLGLSTLH